MSSLFFSSACGSLATFSHSDSSSVGGHAVRRATAGGSDVDPTTMIRRRKRKYLGEKSANINRHSDVVEKNFSSRAHHFFTSREKSGCLFLDKCKVKRCEVRGRERSSQIRKLCNSFFPLLFGHINHFAPFDCRKKTHSRVNWLMFAVGLCIVRLLHCHTKPCVLIDCALQSTCEKFRPPWPPPTLQQLKSKARQIQTPNSLALDCTRGAFHLQIFSALFTVSLLSLPHTINWAVICISPRSAIVVVLPQRERQNIK